MLSLTLWSCRDPKAKFSRRTAPAVFAALFAAITILALVWLGVPNAARADDGTVHIRSVRAAEQSARIHSTHVETRTIDRAPLKQPASPQPEAVTPANSGHPGASIVRSERLAGTGIDAVWLLPLGVGLAALGALFVVLMRRHRDDDID